jgi:hypothetical protein
VPTVALNIFDKKIERIKRKALEKKLLSKPNEIARKKIEDKSRDKKPYAMFGK